MQGAQKLRSEAHLRVRRNDEVAAQRRRWTFYETINIGDCLGWGALNLDFFHLRVLCALCGEKIKRALPIA